MALKQCWKIMHVNLHGRIFFVHSGSEEMPMYTETNVISSFMLCFHVWGIPNGFTKMKEAPLQINLE